MSDYDFLINNQKVDELKQKLNYFNPIEIMGMKHMEIRHSAILGWLLNPRENHGLGDEFLTRFLAEAFKSIEDNDIEKAIKEAGITAENIFNESLHNAIIRTEESISGDGKDKIDILIEFPRLKWIIIVENKIHSGKHSNQLARYWLQVQEEKRFNDYHIAGIFLTKYGSDPYEDEGFQEMSKAKSNTNKKPKRYTYIKADKENMHEKKLPYAPLGHIELSKQLSSLQELKKDSISIKIKNFIDYYIDAVTDVCGKNKRINEATRIAKEIYRNNENSIEKIEKNKDSDIYIKNKKILDFIIKNKNTKFENDVEKIFGENGNIAEKGNVNHSVVYLVKDKYTFSFLPLSWQKIFNNKNENINKYKTPNKWKNVEYWWHGYPIICWITRYDNENWKKDKHLRLYAEVGPLAGDPNGANKDDLEMRKGLMEKINNAIKKIDDKNKDFFSVKEKFEAKYSKFSKYGGIREPLNNDNYEEAIKNLLNRFTDASVLLDDAIQEWVKESKVYDNS